MHLAFYKAPGNWADRIIRWGTNSAYSHVELIGPDGLGWSSSVREGRVRRKAIDFDDGNWDVVPISWLSKEDEERIIDTFWNAYGAKYDYVGILLAHMFALNRSHPERWFCSELIAEMLGLPEPVRYSPGSLSEIVRFLNGFKGAR